MDKRRLITKVSSLQDRQKVWEDAIQAAQKHLELGQALQEQGQEMITALSEMEVTAEQAAKLIQQGTAIIEKGIKIERDSLDKIISLHECVPR